MDIQEFIATRVARGETVILRCGRVISQQEHHQIIEQLRQAKEATGVSFVVLPCDISIEAVADKP